MSSRILVIGGTGIMGQHLAKASLAAGHPTALLVRPANAADPSKLKLLEALKRKTSSLLHDMNRESNSGEESDFSHCVGGHERPRELSGGHQTGGRGDLRRRTLGHHGPEELYQGQLNIVAAINQAGNVKLFGSPQLQVLEFICSGLCHRSTEWTWSKG
ncbi:hypothetical protein HU200_064288 [Digitaria exilis]|uniref:NmrA-like domain-containing protein n=1 Tax=Digitaria exilis TaxID=1010633 RepID=A0A835A4J6_9POAL|nr:hypothetical protein HU200_064288 [Digitaria exilis]